ncbi:PstS family phosphate ABC transporter substrate-binding protein [Nocardia salmonicida]|uniref:PstS family phosphate ABC transporter substrate-binding protein n=1 Tax=Nocardia salmonicida TaxID=53431 RepID=UPI0037B8C329
MSEIPIDIVLSVIGIAVAVAAFLREFVFVGRKHLGYRVQMNTPVSRIPLMVPNGSDMTMVLIRIENDGGTVIDDDDYRPADRPSLIFPGHSVQATEVTERVTRSGERRAHDHFSSELRAIETSTTAQGQGRIVLPREILQRGEHYKVLALLQAQGADPITDDREIVVHGGNLKGGSIHMTTTRSRREPLLLGFSLFLAVVFVIQLIYAVVQPDPPPKDCADGRLTIVGSTAMAPMIRRAAQSYEKTCTEASFAFDFTGTDPGLRTLARAGQTPNMLAIGDGAKGNTFEGLIGRPLAVGSFSMVLHPGVGLKDLTTQQIRDLYRGNVKNWSQLGGPDLPVVLIDRTAGSGTRRALESRLLEDDRKVFRYTSCFGMASGGEQCEVDLTEEVATFVAKIPGAVGYLETSAVTAKIGATSIDGVSASPDAVRAGRYPFTGVEYAYTHGPVAGDSLVAQFIDYLTHGKARLTMIEFGNIPCVDPVEPVVCTP